MQTIFVVITFAVALGYLLKKFVWPPIFQTFKKPFGARPAGTVSCGKKGCGCH